MSDQLSREKRAYVRVPFRGNVTFRVVDKQEFQQLCEEKRCQRAAGINALVSDSQEEPKQGRDAHGDSNLVRFLLHLEDKLDRILGLLGDKPEKGMVTGYGMDISSSGLKFQSGTELKEGQYLEMRFVVSRYPIVCLDIMGEVVRVTPLEGEDAGQFEVAACLHHDDDQVAESIMAYAFRVQRESLRIQRLNRQEYDAGSRAGQTPEMECRSEKK